MLAADTCNTYLYFNDVPEFPGRTGEWGRWGWVKRGQDSAWREGGCRLAASMLGIRAVHSSVMQLLRLVCL